jgi:hypothetical protein
MLNYLQMKKLYISLSLMAMGVAAIAQNVAPISKNPAKRVLTKNEVSPTTVIGHQEINHAGTTDRVVAFQENFQGVTISGSNPGVIPAGWSTNETTTATAGVTTPAFKIYNSTIANAGGYWPVPQVGVGNKFAGVDDDPAPCDCDFVDAWLQTPSIALNEYDYTTVSPAEWGIITSTPVTDIWTDSQNLGSGPQLLTTIPAPNGSIQWTEVGLGFSADSASALPLIVNINGFDVPVFTPGSVDVSAYGLTGDLNITITTADGITLITNVMVDAAGTYETGEFTYDTIPANQGDAGAIIVTPAVVDSTFIGNYTLGFDYFHDQNFGGGEATVQVSNDGGASWTIIDTLTVDGSYWQSIVLPLYTYNGQNISIRFQWSDNGAWASGFAVDNVVVQSALNNDMIMAKTIASDWNNATFGLGFWEYSQVPVSQVSPIRATSVVYNGGFNDQLGVTVDYEVSFNGNAQATWSTTALDVVSLDKDTLSAVSSWTPSSVGSVSIASTVVSPAGDDNLANNTGSASLEITNDIYARDLGAAQAFVGPAAAYEYGNLFDIYANDTVGAIDVAVNFAAADEGSLIQGKLYEFTGLDATGLPTLTDLGISTIEYSVTAADNNAAGGSTFIHLSFTDQIVLEAGKVYMASIISDGAIRTPVAGNNDFVVSWLNSGTGWGATGGIPMIRLNFDESLMVDLNVAENINNGVVLSQNMPNPASSNTVVNYSLTNNERVNLIVRDITGRIVMNINEGVQAAGNHSININVDQLGAGIYTYTLNAGNVQMTKEMMVK